MSEDRIIHFSGTYDQLIDEVKSKGTLCVVDFFADWCGTCQRLGQLLPGIAQTYPDVSFFKVNIDQNSEVAARFGVSSIPNVFFMIGEKIVDNVLGADIPRIKAKIDQYREEARKAGAKSNEPKKMTEKSEDGIYRFSGNYKEIMNEIALRKNLCVVLFTASWSETCASLMESIKSIINEFQNVSFYEIDVDENKNARVGFNVLVIPSIYFVKGDKIITDVAENKFDEIKEAITKNQ